MSRLEKRHFDANAGVVHENVEGADALFHFLCRRCHCPSVGDIDTNRMYAGGVSQPA
jgi:hypothetical protein